MFGEELMIGTAEHMIVDLVASAPPEDHDPHSSRKAQLAGRFLARLPSGVREKAYETLARSAPEWYPIIKASTLSWLPHLAHNNLLLSSQNEIVEGLTLGSGQHSTLPE